MRLPRRLIAALAHAALAGPWARGEILERFGRCLGLDADRYAGLARLARTLADEHDAAPDDPRLVQETLRGAAQQMPPSEERALPSLRVVRWLVPEPEMRAPRFDVPALRTSRDVADLLQVHFEALRWLADPRGLNPDASSPRLHHYRSRWVKKRSGGVRLIEAPKPTLAIAQRRLLDRILVRWPTHDAAHGFVRGRGVLDHAGAHVGQRIVVRMDLEDFFWSIGFERARGVFRSAGYPAEPARLLAGLCVTSTPPRVFASAPELPSGTKRTLRRSHLPQGAPSSPALANLCAFGLDRRLSALAEAFGGTYTRYADDLAFSGDAVFARDVGRLLPRVGAVVLEEGFRPNHRKTRVMRAGRRQQLCGVVVNEKPALPRRELERLEATLVNCARRGPASQNREARPEWRAHLEGRVAWVERVSPARGAKLRAWLERIDWSS